MESASPCALFPASGRPSTVASRPTDEQNPAENHESSELRR